MDDILHAALDLFNDISSPDIVIGYLDTNNPNIYKFEITSSDSIELDLGDTLPNLSNSELPLLLDICRYTISEIIDSKKDIRDLASHIIKLGFAVVIAQRINEKPTNISPHLANQYLNYLISLEESPLSDLEIYNFIVPRTIRYMGVNQDIHHIQYLAHKRTFNVNVPFINATIRTFPLFTAKVVVDLEYSISRRFHTELFREVISPESKIARLSYEVLNSIDQAQSAQCTIQLRAELSKLLLYTTYEQLFGRYSYIPGPRVFALDDSLAQCAEIVRLQYLDAFGEEITDVAFRELFKRKELIREYTLYKAQFSQPSKSKVRNRVYKFM